MQPSSDRATAKVAFCASRWPAAFVVFLWLREKNSFLVVIFFSLCVPQPDRTAAAAHSDLGL